RDFHVTGVQTCALPILDRRKVGRPLEQAIFAKPNCTRVFQSALPVSNVIVQMGPILDGVAAHMADYSDDVAFRPLDLQSTDIAEIGRASCRERVEMSVV